MQPPPRVFVDVAQRNGGSASGGYGLSNMVARGRAVGGTVTVASEPGRGTIVRLTVPIR